MNVLRPLNTLNNLLDESDLVLCLDPLEATYKILITLPRPYLPETLKVMQPLVFVTEDIRNEISKQSVCALDPLPRIDSLWNVLQFRMHYVVELAVNYALGSVKLLH